MNFRVCLSLSLSLCPSSIFRPVCTHLCMFMLAANVEGYDYVSPNRYVLFMCIYIYGMCPCLCVFIYMLHVFYFTCIFVQKIVGRRDFF